MSLIVAIKIQTHYIKYCLISFVVGVIVSLVICGAYVLDYRKRIDEARRDTAEIRAIADRLQSINTKLQGELKEERGYNQRIIDRVRILERENQLQRAFIESIKRRGSEFKTTNNEFRGIIEAIRARGPIIQN